MNPRPPLRQFAVLRRLLSTHWIVLGATGFMALANASITVTNSDPVLVRNAILGGGTVLLGFDGVIRPTRSYVVGTNTTVDGSGHSVTFDIGGLDRHFRVT